MIMYWMLWMEKDKDCIREIGIIEVMVPIY